MKNFKTLLTSLVLVLTLILSSGTLFAETTYRGIDVSAWQGSIDFQAVKDSGVEVVYIRAGYGYNEDSYFEQNYEGARAAGLLIGFYHYTTPSSQSDAVNQAHYFYDLIKDKKMDYPPAMDYESFSGASNAQINAMGMAYIETLAQLTGVTPTIYSDDSNIANLWYASFSKYPLWAAEYGVSAPRTLGNWNDWMGFQYSESGSEPGMGGNSVDLDFFKADGRISSEDFERPAEAPKPVSTYHTVYTTYLIQKGDNIFEIARSQGATVQQVIQANNLKTPWLLIYGKTLKIPHWVKKTATETTAKTRTVYTDYIVQAGNTLDQIADSNNVTVSQLIQTNHITNPNLLEIGQVIRIPHQVPVTK